jgi:hypothetical protein
MVMTLEMLDLLGICKTHFTQKQRRKKLLWIHFILTLLSSPKSSMKKNPKHVTWTDNQ